MTTAPAAAPAAPEPVVPPQCARCPPPPYPEIAQRLGLKGRVRLRLDVDEKGAVTRVQVLEGPRELADGAAKWVKRLWRYRPATRGGAPVPCTVEVPLEFR
jgi:protein TonB